MTVTSCRVLLVFGPRVTGVSGRIARIHLLLVRVVINDPARMPGAFIDPFTRVDRSMSAQHP